MAAAVGELRLRADPAGSARARADLTAPLRSTRDTPVGVQAVIEGVMMRGVLALYESLSIGFRALGVEVVA